MSDYIDKIKKETREVDIHDARLSVSSADIGKLIGVDANGQLAIVDAPSGGTKLYKHQVVLSGTTYTFISTISTAISDFRNYPNMSFKIIDSSAWIDGESADYMPSFSYILRSGSGNVNVYVHELTIVSYNNPGGTHYAFKDGTRSIFAESITDTVTEL